MNSPSPPPSRLPHAAHVDTMPPRRRTGYLGYLGVRRRQNGYIAEIRCGDMRVPLGTFQSAYAAARAYDAAAWRLGRTPQTMNFRDCRSAQEAANLAPAPAIVTDRDRRALRLRAVLDLVEERDALAVQAWYQAHPAERDAELEHWNTMAAERGEQRLELHYEREERRLMKAQAEGELARGRAWWPAGHEMWRALEDEVSDTTSSDADFSDDSDWDI